MSPWKMAVSVHSRMRLRREERNIYGNPTLVHSLFDATLYGMLQENENITLLLNTSCLDACAENNIPITVAHAFIGFDTHNPNEWGVKRFGRAAEYAK